MEEKPKRKSSRSPIKIIIIGIGTALFLCIGFIVAVFGLTTTLLAPASDVTHAFMDALHDDEYEVAFGLFASGLKTELETADNLRSLIVEGDAKPASWTFNNQSVENNSGRFSGEVTLENGESVPITISLVYENDEWRIIAFEWGN